jgi:uncharacterized protein
MPFVASNPATIAAQIDAHCEEIANLCSRYVVRRLELFGSAAAGSFDPEHSDLDLLVELGEPAGMTPFEQYFGLKESLEALFGRSVDLVMAGAPQNRHFLDSVNKSRRLLYAA